MSRRGGGRGGRTDNRRDQPTISSPQSSSSRGGGGGGGGERGRGGGRGERGTGNIGRGTEPVATTQSDYPPLVAKPSASPVAASTSSAPSRPSPTAVSSPAANPQQTQSSAAPAPVAVVSTTASATGTSLSSEVEKKLVLQSPPPSSSKALRFPQRPGYGTIGTKILVRANHFLVEIADKDLHQYDVSMIPEVTSKKVCRDVMRELSDLHCASHLGGRMFAYDGRKSLYTAGPLPFISKEFVLKLGNDAESSSSIRRIREYKVTIKFASKPDLHHLQQFISGRQLDVPQETIQVLDVVLRASPSELYTVIGRSFFAPNLGPRGESGRGDLGYGIEYWRGFYQSLRPTQMGLSLNVDISARSFYDPIPVTDFIKKHFNFRDTSRPLSDQDRVKIKRALRGVRVEVTHQGNSKKYKVTGVSSLPLSQLTFPLEDGSRMSVVKYFREKYGVMLKDVALPALQAGNDSNPVFLPMEVCRIVAGQRYTKKLNEAQVTALLRATCRRPDLREEDIKQMVERSKFNEDMLVSNEFGIRVKEQLTMVEARVLPPPMLKYHDSGKEVKENPRMGAWNMINKRMINGGQVEFWTCINFSTRVHPNMPFDFCGQLVDMCISKGMNFKPDPLIPIHSVNPAQIERALNEVHKQSQAELKRRGQENKRLQLLIIILPDKTGSYGMIKRVCETELGIISQCCQPKEASKLKKQYFENVSLKINVKVGGRNTVLNDAINGRMPLVNDRPTIILGADVTHPQPGEDSCPSIAAVVASMDWPEVTKYRGIVAAQEHRQEIIQDLFKTFRDPQKGEVSGGIVRELLIAFRRSTGHKPHRIIFYRDGVSEGQFSQVLFYEVDAIRKACQSLEEGYLPPITFVVVQKRHHTRLFPADPKNKDRSGNILPGTVVEHKICHPTEFDFYLNSHAGIQGTSRPAHYHVLYDENRFTADALQTLTNNLCYTYARCTRAVSIVPPAYYAHLAAFRARYYIEGNGTDSGSTEGVRNLEFRPLPAIKEHIKDVMFFC